jgi:uncharacterized membrane protein (UPF0127 family)
MNSLYKKSNTNILLTEELETANSTWKRLKGLLGTKELSKNQMLWIHTCNSIHTFFMNYAIDCLFLDKNLVICSIKENIPPWRTTIPVLKATSVIEMQSGRSNELELKEGDQLYVGT